MSELPDFGDWRIELVENYQGQPHLVGAQIVNDAFMICEIRGAVAIAGRPHELHMEAASLIAAAPRLRDALKAARWYVADHQEAQPNDETQAHLAQIDATLAALEKAPHE